MGRVREEVNSVADQHNSDRSMPLKDRLMSVPLEAWDSGFPVIDLCLREVIRLQLSGTAFRKNTGPDIPIDDVSESVARDFCVSSNRCPVSVTDVLRLQGRHRDHSKRQLCYLLLS